MKKYSLLVLVTALVLFVSCNDQSADSAGPVTDSSASSTNRSATDNSQTTTPATPAEEKTAPPSTVSTEKVVKDTPRTSISVGKDGASVQTKKGTGVSYDKSGIKVERKDVKIDIKRDTL